MDARLLKRPATSRPKEWTAAEYLQLTEVGIFPEGGRTELIDGKIIEMAGMGTPHFMASAALRGLLTKALDDGTYFVLQQLPISLDDRSEPEPDLCVVRGSLATLRARRRKPIPEEVALLIEISDSTYEFDSTAKLSMYARAGIQEYWIVNLKLNVVEQHTQPMTVETEIGPRGQYGRKSTYGIGGEIETLELGVFGVGDFVG